MLAYRRLGKALDNLIKQAFIFGAGFLPWALALLWLTSSYQAVLRLVLKR